MLPTGDERESELRALLTEAAGAADELLGTALTAEQRRSVERVRDRCGEAMRLLGDRSPPAADAAAAPSGAPGSDVERPAILLVEDNEVNRRVARLLLENRGYAVDVAADGREAVVATARTAFRAVLMDCHMPRVDGYVATAEIRAREGSGARLPIIAMTANAGPGARERCLSAGMDDYVAKPVSGDALDAVLRRWIPRMAPRPAAAPPPTSNRPSVPPIDLAMLRRLRTGPTPLGTDIVTEVIAIFRVDAPVKLAALRDAAARGDLPGAARAAHTLKGSAGHLGAKALAAVCARFEEKVKAAAAFDADVAMRAIADELERVLAALASEPRSSAPGPMSGGT